MVDVIGGSSRVPSRFRSLAVVVVALAAVGLGVPTGAGAAATVVSLEFDHARTQQLSLLPVLARHGVHATFFVNSGHVGTSPQYMTWDQLRLVYFGGNEIAGHTLTHADPAGLTVEQERHEVCDDRANLLNHGFAASDFASPFGSTRLSQSIVRGCGYNSARHNGGLISPTCLGCPYAESIPPGNPYATRTAPSIYNNTPLSLMQSYVTRAEDHGGGWVQIVAPYTCDTCIITPGQLEEFLRWLDSRAAGGTVVRTVQQVIGGRLQPGPAGTNVPVLPVPPPGSGLLPASRDTIAPVIVRFSLTRRGFAVGRPVRGSRRGTTFRYVLSEPGRVTFRIQRPLPGRRARGRCRRPTGRLLHAKRCTRYQTVGKLARTVRRLSNRTPFSGRIGRRALRSGRYRVVATETDFGGNRSKPRTARFTVFRR